MMTTDVAPRVSRRPGSDLTGRVALVTGGSRGIGAGIAQRLAADGAHVMVTYGKSRDKAMEVVDAISASGGVARSVQADSATERDVVRSVSATVAELGRLDILVNNAGVGGLSLLHELTLADIDLMLAVNVRAVLVATQSALRYLPEGGRIINIGSVNADRMPFAGGSLYATTKAAVAGFTRGLARELAPRHITVNNIQPGPVDTDLNPANGSHAHLMFAAMASDRFGTVDEIGALASFLAGPEAAFITGASITIDGGFGA